jgi:hypothetical protein
MDPPTTLTFPSPLIPQSVTATVVRILSIYPDGHTVVVNSTYINYTPNATANTQFTPPTSFSQNSAWIVNGQTLYVPFHTLEI